MTHMQIVMQTLLYIITPEDSRRIMGQETVPNWLEHGVLCNWLPRIKILFWVAMGIFVPVSLPVLLGLFY